MTDDDRRLAERLRRYELRVPVDADAPVTIRPPTVPWAALAGLAAVIVLAVLVATGLVNDRLEVGDAIPTAHPSALTAHPSVPPTPSSGAHTLVPIDGVALVDRGQRLIVEFIGSPSSCMDYHAQITAGEDVLEVEVVGSWRPLPSDAGCRAIGEVRQLDIALDPAFGGSKVLDVVSGRSFTVGSPEPSASAAPAATPLPPPPTPAPTPVVGVSGVEWADSPGTTIDGNVTMIVSLGGRFHALGSHYDGSLSTPAIWSSADGSAWVRTFLPRPDGSEHRYVGVSSLLSLEGRLVAIGAVSISDYAETVVWESADGRTWTEVDTGAFRGEGVAPTDASTGPSGIVVTTAKYIPTDDSVWRSRDGGRTWTEHRPAGEHVIVGPIVGTQQGYVLGGATADDEWGDTSHPAIWTSQDGTNWRAATVEGAGGRGAVVHVTVDGSGRWAAIGTLNDRTVIWRSADRERWTVTADLGSATVRYSSGYRLTGAPGGFIAFHATEPAVTWTSEDGVTWKSQEDSLFGRFAPAADIGWTEGIARIDERVMVVGGTLGSDGWLPWVGTIRR